MRRKSQLSSDQKATNGTPPRHSARVKLAIVVSTFHSDVTERLLQGAIEAYQEKGISSSSLFISRVPGAFEIPLAAKRWAESRIVDGILTLGVVIQGETDHYHYVCEQAAAGIQCASLETGIPILFGVLTTHTLSQALQRAGKKEENVGYSYAHATLQMIEALEVIPKRNRL